MTKTPSLDGLHHVTAVTSSASENVDFYTRILGMRLVKKTVNQDDVSAYHLFYGDAVGSPGSDFTFFDWRGVPSAREGSGTLSETALRVLDGGAPLEVLAQWTKWFDEQGVEHDPISPAAATRYPSLAFSDPEGQRLRLIAEPDSGKGFHPWKGAPVALGAAIVGLSEVTLSVREIELTRQFLVTALGFRPHADDPTLFETGAGGPGAQLRLLPGTAVGTAGAGGVHHVAWSVPDVEALRAWKVQLARFGVASSGPIDRHYFQSLYFRIPGGILFELATTGPGFTADGEEMEHLGEKLSLPPFLEASRAQIEAGLIPLASPATE